MIRRIVLSIFCCLLAYPFLVARQRDWSLPTPEADLPVALIPVSYTHLTLPTICSV